MVDEDGFLSGLQAALRRKISKEVIHSSVICSDFTEDEEDYKTMSPSPSGKFIERKPEPDLDRELYLKGTLNLVSPIKRSNLGKKITSKRISVVGGASGGAFLKRSLSQPSILKTPIRSTTKLYAKCNLKKWRY